MLATNQLALTLILTRLPIWPDIARQESVAPLNPAMACLSIKIRDAEPEISSTLPISKAVKLTGATVTFDGTGLATRAGSPEKGLLVTKSDTFYLN
jgi:hypothetical protein